MGRFSDQFGELTRHILGELRKPRSVTSVTYDHRSFLSPETSTMWQTERRGTRVVLTSRIQPAILMNFAAPSEQHHRESGSTPSWPPVTSIVRHAGLA